MSQQYDSTLAADHAQLNRVQSANYSFSVAREDINQYGLLARIDSLVLESPTVSFDFSYYITDGYNESALGFYVQTGAAAQGGFASGHMVTTSGKNFFIVTSPEGTDLDDGGAIGASEDVIGLGNGFLSDYSLEMSVGAIPTATVSIEALNMRSDADATAIDHPAIYPNSGVSLPGTVALPTPTARTGAAIISALRPGDIVLSFGDFETDGTGQVTTLGGVNGAHIQSATLSLPLSRSALERLGSKFAYARAVDFPITASLSVNAIVNEIDSKNLVDLLEDTKERDVAVTLKAPDGSNALIVTMKGCILQDESFSSAIGSNKSVDLTFTAQIGGPQDLTHNIFMSGSYATAPF